MNKYVLAFTCASKEEAEIFRECTEEVLKHNFERIYKLIKTAVLNIRVCAAWMRLKLLQTATITKNTE